MSLYLCIFDGDKELTGWCFGHYSDFGYFRDVIAKKLRAAEYPIFMQHSDCDGQWPVGDLLPLRAELVAIAEHFKKLPPQQPSGAFEHTEDFRKTATSLYDCFHNVDGENIFDALIALCDEGIARGKSILFQ